MHRNLIVTNISIGDNDPIDAVELSSNPGVTGQVKQVKILGTYAMIDEGMPNSTIFAFQFLIMCIWFMNILFIRTKGETDWKVLCIDVNDPLAKEVNSMLHCV